MAFHFGKIIPPSTTEVREDINKNLKNLIINNLGESYSINRIMKFYTHNNGDDIIYFIKPKMLRFWLKSIALRDADEVINDLIESGF